MVRVLAINGSPRKTWNTATLLGNALEGAESKGADTCLVHLYDLDFTGCRSCFACKVRGGKSYGRCASQDGLTEFLNRVREADALILGSPIYFGTVTGTMRCFMERLLFPYLTYTRPPQSLFGRTIPTAFIYTMNVSQQQMQDAGYMVHISSNENVLRMMFGYSEALFSFETLQFEDYGKVVFEYCDPRERLERRRTVFPRDCEEAYRLGERFGVVDGYRNPQIS